MASRCSLTLIYFSVVDGPFFLSDMTAGESAMNGSVGERDLLLNPMLPTKDRTPPGQQSFFAALNIYFALHFCENWLLPSIFTIHLFYSFCLHFLRSGEWVSMLDCGFSMFVVLGCFGLGYLSFCCFALLPLPLLDANGR